MGKTRGMQIWNKEFDQIHISAVNTPEFWLRLHPVWKCTSLQITFHKNRGKRRKSPTTLILNAINYKDPCNHVLGGWNLFTVGWKHNPRRAVMVKSFMRHPCSESSSLSAQFLKKSCSSQAFKTLIISETGGWLPYSNGSPKYQFNSLLFASNLPVLAKLPISEHQCRDWHPLKHKENYSGDGQTAAVLNFQAVMTHCGYIIS